MDARSRARERARERRREHTLERRRESYAKFHNYFQTHGGQNIWTKYREQVKDSNPYVNIADKAVEEVIKTIGAYETYVKVREKDFKKDIKEKDDQIRKLMDRIAELEKSNRAKDEQIKKLQEVDSRALNDFKKVKSQAEAAFRGDKFGEKAGEKASAQKDTYERLIEEIISRGKIHMSSNRIQSLMNSSDFARTFKSYVDKGVITSERLEELWALNFSGEAPKKSYTQFGLSSDRDENWDYSRDKVYHPAKSNKRKR